MKKFRMLLRDTRYAEIIVEAENLRGAREIYHSGEIWDYDIEWDDGEAELETVDPLLTRAGNEII